MDKQQNYIQSLNFTAANLPTFEEVVNNKEWVFWGSDNLWPNHSIELYNYSSILRSALNSIRDAVVGKEMYIGEIPADRVMANGSETVYDIYKKVVVDYVIHNGFSLNTILRRDKEGISQFYHMDISKLRSGKADNMDNVNDYWFSSDWTNTRKYQPVELPSFDLTKEEPSQVYFYKTYQPAQFYYPVNEWIACRMAAEIDTEIKNYHLNNLQNGYHSGTIFSMNNGVPSEDERNQIYRHLEEKYTSTNRAGGIIVTFSDDKEHEPTVTPVTNNASPDMFIQLNEMVQQTILTSTRISNPTLLGIKTVQGLGSKEEMVDAYEHFLSTVVKPIQKKLIREFEKILFFQTGEIRDITIEQNELFDVMDKEQIEGLE